ncbi:cation-transporting P-type ATPase, partial [Bosea vestrisii]
MKRLSFDFETVMSGLAVLGMILAVIGTWPPAEGISALRWPGLVLVYAAGGIPAAWSALSALWREHVLDIDLLMVVAAIAAAAVGAPFEGAVLLTLFTDIPQVARRLTSRSPDFARW